MQRISASYPSVERADDLTARHAAELTVSTWP